MDDMEYKLKMASELATLTTEFTNYKEYQTKFNKGLDIKLDKLCSNSDLVKEDLYGTKTTLGIKHIVKILTFAVIMMALFLFGGVTDSTLLHTAALKVFR